MKKLFSVSVNHDYSTHETSFYFTYGIFRMMNNFRMEKSFILMNINKSKITYIYIDARIWECFISGIRARWISVEFT